MSLAFSHFCTVLHILHLIRILIFISLYLHKTSLKLALFSGEGYMHKLWWELQVKHFDRQMLSLCIMNCYTSVLTAANEIVSIGTVSNLHERQIKLGELICNAGLLNVENTHHS